MEASNFGLKLRRLTLIKKVFVVCIRLLCWTVWPISRCKPHRQLPFTADGQRHPYSLDQVIRSKLLAVEAIGSTRRCTSSRAAGVVRAS